jgi:succinyl-CoA synthetase alpha subunit
MGHAGAIVMGDKGTYASKRSALEAAGVTVLDTPSDVSAALKAGLGRSADGARPALSAPAIA